MGTCTATAMCGTCNWCLGRIASIQRSAAMRCSKCGRINCPIYRHEKY